MSTSTPETENTVEDVDAPVSIFDICETDSDAVENGKWFTGEELWGPRAADSGIRIKLRRFTSRASLKSRQRLEKKYRKFFDKKKQEYPPEIVEKMVAEQLADAIIVDWEGIRDRDGKEIAYSPEAALALVSPAQMADFRMAISAKALEMDNWRTEEREEITKN
jgi:hypothetical protein